MKPCIPEILNQFAEEVQLARNAWNTANPAGWLVFYEAKQEAYENLCEKIPQIKEIPDFWRWVQNSQSLDWITWTEREITRITHSAACPCGKKLKWPQKLCDKCQEDRKMKAKQSKKLRKAVNKRVKALSRAKKGSRTRRMKKTVPQ